MSPSQLDLVRLGLQGRAYTCAVAIAKQHPDVVFTSGRRTKSEQARVMARNIVRSGDRDWVKHTYKPSDIVAAIGRWLREHPKATNAAEIEHGIAAVFAATTDTELKKISKHLTGDAFDIAPVDGLHGQLILQTLRGEVRRFSGELLENEGGIRVWHAQF